MKLVSLFTLLLAGLLVCPSALAAAFGKTVIHDVLEVETFGSSKNTIDWRTKSFVPDPSLGLVWIVVDYLAQGDGSDGSAMSSFEVMPDRVPVPMGDNFAIFNARRMNRFSPEPALTLTVGGMTKPLAKEDLRRLMGEKQYDEWMASRREHYEHFLNLVQVLRFDPFYKKELRPGEDTFLSVRPQTMNGLTPKALRIVVGQGDIPVHIKEYMEKQNGPWWYRYRHPLAIALGTLVFLGLSWRLLWGGTRRDD